MAERYINRNSALLNIEKAFSIYKGDIKKLKVDCRLAVLTPPVENVVKVVRCKDCKHFNEIGTDYCIKHNKGYCEWDNTIKPKNHYCGYGEKK